MKGNGEVESEIGLYTMTITSSIFDEIRKREPGDVKLETIKAEMIDVKNGMLELHEDNSIRFKGQWCVPEVCGELKRKIMEVSMSSNSN